MPATFDARRLRHQRAMDARLTADHRRLANIIAGMVLRAGTGRDAKGTPIIPPTRATRDALKAQVWENVLKPYYVGQGTDPLRGPTPQSPYAKLLVDGIEQATRIQAERQAAIVRRVCHDEVVVQWLTGPRPFGVREMDMRKPQEDMSLSHMGLRSSQADMRKPHISGPFTELLAPTRDTIGSLRRPDGRIDPSLATPAAGQARATAGVASPRGMYDAFHQFVDPNGYRLSDRIWRTSIDVRSRVDRLLDYHIAQGTPAVDIARLMEPFLTPGGALSKTKTPYGSEGSYSARRLARTEITAAAGRATVNASAANPFVQSIQWRLSGSHADADQCDDNAHGGPSGDGIYPIDRVPTYPNHPHELCSLLPVPSGSTADLVTSLRADIQAARGNLIDAASGGNAARANALRGIMNVDYLTNAIMSGSLLDSIVAAVSSIAGRIRRVFA